MVVPQNMFPEDKRKTFISAERGNGEGGRGGMVIHSNPFSPTPHPLLALIPVPVFEQLQILALHG